MNWFSITFKAFLIITIVTTVSFAQESEMKPQDTEVWEPAPREVTPNGFVHKKAPSDAIILFSGNHLKKWESTNGNKAGWRIQNNYMTVASGSGSIRTKKRFGSVQLHIEWRSPKKVEGKGQGRGNSGVFLQGRYEVQVLDSYQNETYVNGMAASIYKQHIPKVNATRKPGEWQSYDIIFRAPEFNEQGQLTFPGRITMFWNGILVHNNVKLEGPTKYIGIPEYKAHGKAPLVLQDHNNPVSYRNIWVRELN